MEEWLDREKLKSKISAWLVSDISQFLLITRDSQEFEDITRWLETLNDYKFAVAYLNTDSETTRFGLLKEITSSFGSENFPEFNALYESLSTMDPHIIIEQRIGTDINAFKTVTSHNSQTININTIGLESVKTFYIENKANDFLDKFLMDLAKIDFGIPSVILCRFRGKGFDELENEFKTWFQDKFIRKIKQFNIKVIILCQTNEGELSNVIDLRFNLTKLQLFEIIPVAMKYLNDIEGLFCKGAVDSDDKITYQEFKMKLKKNIS